MESLGIPGSVQSIQTGTFKGCTALKTIVFDGSAPAIAQDAFASVTATVYYPANDTTWTASVMQNYGGSLTWVAFG